MHRRTALDDPADDHRRMIDRPERADQLQHVLASMSDVADVQDELVESVRLPEQIRITRREPFIHAVRHNPHGPQRMPYPCR